MARRRSSSNVGFLAMAGIAGMVVLVPAARFVRDNKFSIIAAVAVLVALAVSAMIVRRRSARRQAELAQDRLRAVLPFHQMDDKQFEHALASLCRAGGCREIEVSGGAGDRGADVKAVTPDGRRMIVQAKRYKITRRVGDTEMQQLAGGLLTWHDFDLAVMVTTSGFTRPARETAARNNIRLIDNLALAAWNSGTGPSPWA